MLHDCSPLQLAFLSLCFAGWVGTCGGWSLDPFDLEPLGGRWKRQADVDCGTEFRCDSGECIDALLACDGSMNCADESDESEAACLTEPCPSYAFRCKYGACIDSALTCDGNDDCADRSDETLAECTKKCGMEEFECGDEGCVDELLLCDGKKDCDDGTDEEAKLCSNATCPSYAFRCTYGACIDLTLMCDGQPDCVDASDEAKALCRSVTIAPVRPTARPTAKPHPVGTTPSKSVVTPSPITPAPVTPAPVTPPTAKPPVTSAPATNVRGCQLPPQIAGGKFTVQGCEPSTATPECPQIQGTLAQTSVILIHECNAGFTMEGNAFSVCQGSAAWYPPIPRCVQKIVLCPVLKEISVDIVCSKAGLPANCSVPTTPGTEAKLTCNAGYVLAGEPNYRKITCLPTGAWDRPVFTCIPDCGKRNPNGRPFISNGELAKIGEYPWHAGVYQLNSSSLLTQVCGGTLITSKLIISAAHCFWDEVNIRPEKIERYKIALGKFYRDWYLTADDSELQQHEISNIVLDERYRGRKRNFQFDVAIVVLKELAELTWSVNVACVDWDNEYERFQLAPGQKGTVSGWGVTENNKPSELLKSVQLPFVELFPTCYNSVSEAFQPYLTPDKFCAGYTGNRTSVCPGDSGGGLLFQHETTKRYYLRGIVSVGSRPDSNLEKCYTQAYTAFSKFSDSVKWVEKFMNS